MSQEHDAQMEALLEVEAAPVIPRVHPVRWSRENLFPSVISGALTAITALALIGFVYGVLSWVFAPQRDLVPLTPVTAEQFVAYYEGDLELEARTIILLNPDAAVGGGAGQVATFEFVPGEEYVVARSADGDVTAVAPSVPVDVEAWTLDLLLDDFNRTSRVEPDQAVEIGDILAISTTLIEFEVPAGVADVTEFAEYLLSTSDTAGWQPTGEVDETGEPVLERVTGLTPADYVTTAADVRDLNRLEEGDLLIPGETYRVAGSARKWGAISTNSRNYFTLAYPTENYLRVWISFGIVCSLIGLSLAAWSRRPRTSSARIGRKLTVFGAMFTGFVFLAPWSFGVDLSFILVGIVVGFGGWALRRWHWLKNGEEVDDVPLLAIWGGLLIALVGLMWMLPEVIDKMEIASTTKVPLTVMALIAAGSFWLAKALLRSETVARGALKGTLVGLWALSMPVIYMVILRHPALDFTATDVLVGVVIGLIGAGLVWFMTGPNAGEAGKALAGILVGLALLSWFPPLGGIDPFAMIKTKLLLGGLASFGLAASTFGGNTRARTATVGAWMLTAALVTWFSIIGEGGTALDLQSDYLGGMVLTILLAFGGILLSFPIGVMLALGRTSTMPLFRLMSTAYIETVRGVPLITVLFFGALFLPLFLPADLRIDAALKALIAITGFSAAYLAENVRGGLQSISTGQYEASQALGMSTVQMTLFITLPQALRAVIPALVGQVISLFKDTSLVAIIGLADLLLVARAIVPGQPAFIGSQLENLVFVSIVYWIFTYSFSRASLRVEKKLGLGER